MKRIMMLVVVSIITTLNINAQFNDETKGVGGLVLDSLYRSDSEGTRRVKLVYEYNADKKVTKHSELTYFDDDHPYLAEPVLNGYDIYIYDDQKRLKKTETYTKDNGVFRASYATEIAEFDAETSLPSLIYTYETQLSNPDATLELKQKAEVTKYYENKDIAEMTVYLMQDGNWEEMAVVHRDFNERGLLKKEAAGIAGMQLITEYEYDEYDQLSRKVVKRVIQFMGQDIEEVSSDITYTNEYYEDSNLKSVKEINNGELIETSYYFWGKGTISAIQHLVNNRMTDNRWIDLNGRIFNGKPTQRGVYIHHGKKVFN